MVLWRTIETEDFGTDQNVRLGDLNGDGNKELLLARPGPTGYLSSLTAVNLDGEVLWQRGTADVPEPDLGPELPVQIHDLDGDGSREVIYLQGKTVFILHGRNGRYAAGYSPELSFVPSSLAFADVRNVGRRNCPVLSDGTGHVAVFDERFRLLWERKVENGCLPLIRDLNGDGLDDVVMGFVAFDHEGRTMFNVGEYIKDKCEGVAVSTFRTGERQVKCLVFAAGDWGQLYVDFQGHVLKQNIQGHVAFLSAGDFDLERPGLEIVSSNQWGSEGEVHVCDETGKVFSRFVARSGPHRCQPVNWKGDGEEFFLSAADSVSGGLLDVLGQQAVAFPDDGHPVRSYQVLDLTGDARDEILVWDASQIRIYTQSDNPRMGKTYDPERPDLFNYSTSRMVSSLPGW
ncbi:MAG: hypothetical protein R2751_15460 [Bacteroidales bacterium]